MIDNNRFAVPWCNGSTSDSGSFCRGSNPCGTAIFHKKLDYCHIAQTLRGGAVVARQAHNLKARGSIPLPATIFLRLKRVFLRSEGF